MSESNGGPAFPVRVDDNNGKWTEFGMTLRDYFAVKFAAAWVIALAARKDEAGYSDTGAALEANRLGELQADAMLKARKEGT